MDRRRAAAAVRPGLDPADGFPFVGLFRRCVPDERELREPLQAPGCVVLDEGSRPYWHPLVRA